MDITAPSQIVPKLGLTEQCRRYGVGNVMMKTAVNLLGRLFEFEICRIGHSNLDELPQPADLPQGYRVAFVSKEEFAQHLKPGLPNDHDWKFERGDVCIAVFHHNEIVGWNFQATQPTRVKEGLEFYYPSGYGYSYASFVCNDHRGKRLASACYFLPRLFTATLGLPPRSAMWYVNVANLASRMSDRGSEDTSILIGYAGYAKLFGRYWCFSGPACRKMGTGFRVSKG